MAAALGQDRSSVMLLPYDNQAVGGSDDAAGQAEATMSVLRGAVAASAPPRRVGDDQHVRIGVVRPHRARDTTLNLATSSAPCSPLGKRGLTLNVWLPRPTL